jgi:hypothetical protein
MIKIPHKYKEALTKPHKSVKSVFRWHKRLLFASPRDKWNLVVKGEQSSIFIYPEHA